MLFTDVSNAEYQLWSARRCAVWLGLGILAFLALVYCSLSAIMIRPSAELKPDAYTSISAFNFQATALKDSDALRAHGIESAERIRLLLPAGESKEFPLDEFHANMIPADTRSAFIVCSERSVWTFLWQRISAMFAGDA